MSPAASAEPLGTMTNFDEDLQKLTDKLLEMASYAESAVARSVRALSERDDELARRVLDDDSILDHYEIEIDEVAVHLLTMAPVASTLRLITVAMKISQNLERVGDEAVKIARRVISLSAEPALAHGSELPRMANMALGMLRAALDAYVKRRPEDARAVIPQDTAVDELNHELHGQLARLMAESPTNITRGLSLLTICRSLERVADHATNIAEEVVYLYEARDIRHSSKTKPHEAKNPGR